MTALEHPSSPARIEYLRVENFRALRSVELTGLTPLTVLTGPNGSGKSTVLDVFAFLADCFQSGLRSAWHRRGRARELKSRGSAGPMVIEIRYRERVRTPLICYRLAVDETAGALVVVRESMCWRSHSQGRPFRFLDYQPDEDDERLAMPLRSPDLLAVNALGQLAEYPRVAALRNFVSGWHLSCLSDCHAQGQAEAVSQEGLSLSGNNLANVVRHLGERYPERLEQVLSRLRRCVPLLERVWSEMMADGRLLLQVKDASFGDPVLARFASDGTLRLLAYLLLVYGPVPPAFIGVEHPEVFLHPRLLYELAEQCRDASGDTQVLVTTHSPFLINALRPQEVRVLWRDARGYTQTMRVADIPEIPDLVRDGAHLGNLWMEGYFRIGDPLAGHG